MGRLTHLYDKVHKVDDENAKAKGIISTQDAEISSLETKFIKLTELADRYGVSSLE